MNQTWSTTTSYNNNWSEFTFEQRTPSGEERRAQLIRLKAQRIRHTENCSKDLAELKALLAWEALDDEAILSI